MAHEYAVVDGEPDLGYCRACHAACLDCMGPDYTDCTDPADWNKMFEYYGPDPLWEFSNFPDVDSYYGFEVGFELVGTDNRFTDCCADGYNVDPNSM